MLKTANRIVMGLYHDVFDKSRFLSMGLSSPLMVQGRTVFVGAGFIISIDYILV